MLSLLVLTLGYITQEFSSTRSQTVTLASAIATIPSGVQSAAVTQVTTLYTRMSVYMAGLLMLAISWVCRPAGVEGAKPVLN